MQQDGFRGLDYCRNKSVRWLHKEPSSTYRGGFLAAVEPVEYRRAALSRATRLCLGQTRPIHVASRLIGAGGHFEVPRNPTAEATAEAISRQLPKDRSLSRASGKFGECKISQLESRAGALAASLIYVEWNSYNCRFRQRLSTDTISNRNWLAYLSSFPILTHHLPSLIRLLHVTQSNRHHAPKPILMHFLHTGIFPDWQIISPKRSIRIVLHGQARKNHHRKPIRLVKMNQTPACKSTGITPRKQIRLAVVDEIPSPGKRSRGMDIVESLKFSCTGFGSDR
ncbi:hypothetical protein V8C43DRAFT_17711 [Trichoderma afarasin]